MVAILILGLGCSDRDTETLAPARGNTDPLVFDDDYGEDVYFQAFFETHYEAVSKDSVYAYEGFAPDGARSLKVNIPPDASALGPYSGGVLTSAGSRNLADFNALTFYARTDSGSVSSIELNEVGFGNDNTGDSLYGASRSDVPLTWNWAFHVIPVPAPSKLISERGLFLFAESLELWDPNDQASGYPYPDGYNIWFDEIKFAKLDNIEVSWARMDAVNSQYFVGSPVAITGTFTRFLVDGVTVDVHHMPAYFDYESTDESVATADGNTVTVVGAGDATITGTLEGLDVIGNIRVTGYDPPTAAAVPPTLSAESVISMFSDVYQDVNVDTWNADWGQPVTVENYVVSGDNTKMYTSLTWAGIEFMNPMIDASAMTHFHLDVYAPEGTDFNLEFVSFPADSSKVLTEKLVFDTSTTPAFNEGTWSVLEFPLTDLLLRPGFDWSRIGQLVISTSDAKLVLVDNAYWHN